MSTNGTISALKSRGWAVVASDRPENLKVFRDTFEEAVRVQLPEDIQNVPFPEVFSKVESSLLNSIFRTVNYSLMDETKKVLGAFHRTITGLCGTTIYFQKRLYLRVNVPGKDHTATPAHSDTFYGHSPYAYTIWIPMWDVTDQSGIWIMSRQQTADVLSQYKFDSAVEKLLTDKHARPESIVMKFGEALFFECGLLHGSRTNEGKKPRVSFDIRVQSPVHPLFQKGFDLYGIWNQAA